MSSRYYSLGAGRDNVPFNTVQKWQDQTLYPENIPRHGMYNDLINRLNILRASNTNFTVLGMHRARKTEGWLDFIRVEGLYQNINRNTLDICVLLPEDPRPASFEHTPVDLLYSYRVPAQNQVRHFGGRLFEFENFINIYFPPPTPDQLEGTDINTIMQWQLDKIKYIASRL